MRPLRNYAGMLFASLVLAAPVSHAQIIQTIAGDGQAGFSGDGGPAVNAELNYPGFLGLDAKGNVYVGDGFNNRIRKVDKNGTISTMGGDGTYGYSGDNGPALAADLGSPIINADSAGNVYIADHGFNRIRKISTNGIITTIAGNGTYGTTGDGGPALQAELETPVEVTTDKAGNVYMTSMNDPRIRKISTNGTITTIAGTGASFFSGDGGPATAATLNGPAAITVDDTGNVYVVDEANERVRKINAATGIITTVIGNGTAGTTGDGGPATDAEIAAPQFMAISKSGVMYLLDYGGARLRRVGLDGIITTIGGTNDWAYAGDDSLVSYAKFNRASDIKIDKFDNLYIADYENQRVRKVTAPPVAMFTPNTGSLCLDSCITFINQSNSDSVNWYISGVTVATPHADTMTACFHQAGQVVVHLYVSNISGVDSTTDTFMVAPCTEGVSIATTVGFSIYPNPAGNEVTVKNAVAGSQLYIYDVTGRIVKKQPLTTTQQSIDISSLPAGSYLFTCPGEKSIILQKE